MKGYKMYIKDSILGECELEICHGSLSAVDSFIVTGYSIDLDRELTDNELNRLQNDYEAEIHEYSYTNGFSRNHN
jgi:hypothetical protein